MKVVTAAAAAFFFFSIFLTTDTRGEGERGKVEIEKKSVTLIESVKHFRTSNTYEPS